MCLEFDFEISRSEKFTKDFHYTIFYLVFLLLIGRNEFIRDFLHRIYIGFPLNWRPEKFPKDFHFKIIIQGFLQKLGGTNFKGIYSMMFAKDFHCIGARKILQKYFPSKIYKKISLVNWAEGIYRDFLYTIFKGYPC